MRVRAIDHSDCATLVIFDRDCTAVFNKSFADFLAEHGNVNLLFLCHVYANILVYFYTLILCHVYAKICLDPSIIKEFMSKWDKEDASFSKLTNVWSPKISIMKK